MPVIPKDPLDWLTLFRQQINEIIQYLAILEQKDHGGEHACTLLVDIFETPDNLMFEIELPGVERKDISLSICCNTLVIEGVKRDERQQGNLSYTRLERCFGRFCKTVEIPPTVDSTKAAARYEKGVLVVSFPRLKDKSGIIRAIPIG